MISSLDFRRSDDGFTLIETLIAFAVLAISLALIIEGVAQATSQMRNAELSNSARKLAQTVLHRMPNQSSDIAGADEATGLSWRVTRKRIARTGQSGPLPSIDVISAEVLRSPDSRPLYVLRSLELVSTPQ